MSSNTQNINKNNSSNAVQASQQKTNSKNAAVKDLGINFGSLFADAIENSTPKAQLNAQETQKKKNNQDTKPIDTETTQSMVWAQRNWNSPPTHTESTVTQPQQMEHHDNTVHSEEHTKTEQDEIVETTQKPANTTPAKQQTNNTSTENRVENATAQQEHEHAHRTALAPVQQHNTLAIDNTTTTALEPNNDKPHANTKATTDQIPLDTPQLQHTIEQHANNIPDTNAPNPINPINLSNTTVATQINQQLGQKEIQAGDLKLTTTSASASSPIANASQTTIKTPINQPGFAKELGQTVHWALGKNMSTVDIRVNPESFGPLNMRIIQKGQHVQLIIRTQDEACANLMTQAISGLKETMAQNGLQLNQIQIQHNTSNPQQTNNAGSQQFTQTSGNGQQQAGSQSHNTRQNTPPESIEHTPETTTGQKIQNAPSMGIDLFA